jgi:hypothetical protein
MLSVASILKIELQLQLATAQAQQPTRSIRRIAS